MPAKTLSIEIRHPKLKDGRCSVLAGTTDPATRDEYRRSILTALDHPRGEEIGERLRLTKRQKGKLTPAEVHQAVTGLNLASLFVVAVAPKKEVAVSPAMLGETIDRFMRQAESDLAEGAARTYQTCCSQIEARFGVRRDEDGKITKDVPVRDIDKEDAREWLKEPKASTGGKPWSAQKQTSAHAVASQLWQMALVQEEDEAERLGIGWKPWRNFWAADRQRPKGTVRPAKKRKTRHQFLTRTQAARLLRANKGTPRAAWVAIGFYAGLRISETANLRTSVDIDQTAERIIVQNRKGEYAWRTKNGKDREVDICPAAMRWIQRHIEDGFAGDRYLFHPYFADRPISEHSATRWTEQAFTDAGIKYGGRTGDGLSYHSLRHTCASWLAIRGHSPNLIAEVLGDTVKIVLETYIHLWPSDKKRAMDALRRKPQK